MIIGHASIQLHEQLCTEEVWMDPSIGRGLNQKCLKISSVFPDFCIHGTSCYNVPTCSNIFQTQMVQPCSAWKLSGWSRGTWPGTSAWAFGAFRAFQVVGAKVGAKAGAGAFQAPGPGPPWWQKRIKIEELQGKYFNKDEERWRWYER